jgi:hypothetical protein
MMNFSFSFDKKTKILYKTYFDGITVQDITSSWLYAFEKKLIPKDTKGFILDYRSSTMNFNPEKHAEIAEFYRKNLHVFRNLKIAVLTENPKDVVISILVKEMDHGYESKPFSTLEAAIHWITSTES